MKKISLLMSAIAMLFAFNSCQEKNEGLDLGGIVLDGFYVYGDATGNGDKVLSVNAMSAGYNEVDKAARAGMYEKYIYLEAGKNFSLIENQGGNKKFYGAEIEEVNYGYDAENPDNCKNFADNPNMLIQHGKLIVGESAPAMQVKESGLYHIVLDNNTVGDLSEGQIIIQKADWGLRGGMNGWGFTKGEAEVKTDGSIVYTWKDQELASKGEFKFASCHGWKINLDEDGTVKAEVSLGLNNDGVFSTPAGNISVEKGGLYDITLTYKAAAGAIEKSFSYTVTLTQESTLPEVSYLIGEGINGWTFPDNAVSMIAAHSEPGVFWAIRYIEAGKGFKFSRINTDWGQDFTGLGNDNGYTVSDNNCFVAETGIYMIEVDYKNNIVAVNPAEVYGMGDCFGNWDEGANPFAVEGQALAVTATATGNVRSYAKSFLEGTAGNWWHREFVPVDGKIVYRATGGDPQAVNVAAGQKVTYDFNAGTAAIK
ncbi:MAG: SusF/SusE family outer membrane protein [Candidatus Cryptobacteroides sp.]